MDANSSATSGWSLPVGIYDDPMRAYFDRSNVEASALDASTCLSLLRDVSLLRFRGHPICDDKPSVEERIVADIVILVERLPMRFRDLGLCFGSEEDWMQMGTGGGCRLRDLLKMTPDVTTGGIADEWTSHAKNLWRSRTAILVAAQGRLLSAAFDNGELAPGWEPVPPLKDPRDEEPSTVFDDDVFRYPQTPIRDVGDLIIHLARELHCLRQSFSGWGLQFNVFKDACRELRNARRALHTWNLPNRGLIDTPADIYEAERQLESLVNWLGTLEDKPPPAVTSTTPPASGAVDTGYLGLFIDAGKRELSRPAVAEVSYPLSEPQFQVVVAMIKAGAEGIPAKAAQNLRGGKRTGDREWKRSLNSRLENLLVTMPKAEWRIVETDGTSA